MTSNFSLEDILDRLAPVPLENRRNLEWLHALDKRWSDKLQELKAAQEKYLQRAKNIIVEQKLPRDGSVDIHKAIHHEEDHARIKQLYEEVLGLANEKMALANQSHDHIAYALSRLNDDLTKQVAELRERGELPSDLAENFGYKYVDDMNSPYNYEASTPTPVMGYQRGGLASASSSYTHQGHYDSPIGGQPGTTGGNGVPRESGSYDQRGRRMHQDSYETTVPPPALASVSSTAAARSHFSTSDNTPNPHALASGSTSGAVGIAGASASKHLGATDATGGYVHPEGVMGIGVPADGTGHMVPGATVGTGNVQTTGQTSRSRNDLLQHQHQHQHQHQPITEVIIEDPTGNVSGEEVFCVCKKVAFGEMVGCEAGEACRGGEWFHLDCVGLKYAPSGSWWCPSCRPRGTKKRRGGGV